MPMLRQIVAPASPRKYLGILAACALLAAFLLACGGDGDAERIMELEAKAHSQEEALERLTDENESLREELAAIKQQQADYARALEEAERAEEEEETILEDYQAEQLSFLLEEQERAERRLDDHEARMRKLENDVEELGDILPLMEAWFAQQDKKIVMVEGTAIERTRRLAESGGGQAQVINYGAAYGGARSAVLVLPDPLPEGEIPLIVSLHGFSGDSFSQSLYVPLHERVNRDGFALLLPDGVENAEGQRFWNPTSGSGKADQDDVNALTALVQEAGGEFEVGPVYFFGYSNGGFMSYWMACQGLPGLRAIASLAGTSYVQDTACEDAAPVSVLHIHGTEDAVVLFEGVMGEPDAEGKDGPGYAGAREMARRWGERTGCDWPDDPQPYATLDLDGYVPGAETRMYRLESGCGEGISIELWVGEGSGHGPAYGDAFVDALLDWLLSQQ